MRNLFEAIMFGLEVGIIFVSVAFVILVFIIAVAGIATLLGIEISESEKSNDR